MNDARPRSQPRTESPTFNLRLTKEQLWTLSQNYDAAFTDPAARTAIEIEVSDKLKDLYQKARRR